MKILQIHNKYQYVGGEDVVYEAEKKLLENYNHSVLRYERNNNEITKFSMIEKISLFKKTSWSNQSFYEVKKIIDKENPNICHVHNFLPLVTPSVYYACKEKDIPVVQTLHNYRLLCSNAYLFKDGNICEECLGKSLYHSVKYGCYRNSYIQTFVLANMVEKHKRLNTWNKSVDAYICLTEFAKNKFIKGGFPENKLFVKPNFIAPNKNKSTTINKIGKEYFLFIGRLDETKGIKLLLSALTHLKKYNINIVIAGDGPLKDIIVSQKKFIYVGFKDRDEIQNLIANSIALIFPSIWYEGFPMTIIEAFANSKAVIASNTGSMKEIIEDNYTGLFFLYNNPKDLADKLIWASLNPEKIKLMGMNAQKIYMKNYSPEKNYNMLIDIYNRAISLKDK